VGMWDKIRSAINPGAEQSQRDAEALRQSLIESNRPADILALRVADKTRDISNGQIRREVPGLYQAHGTTELPNDPNKRWAMIATATKEFAEDFIKKPAPFQNVTGEPIPARPTSLPREIATSVRERSVSDTARDWEPGQRIEHALHEKQESIAWRTSKMFAFGSGHHDNLEKQARELMENPQQAKERFAPVVGDEVGLFEPDPVPADPAKRIGYIRGMLEAETAVVRAGFLGPKHAVDTAMRPEMDFHEASRAPDGMERLAPDYRVAGIMSKTTEDKLTLYMISHSTKEEPVPSCREFAKDNPTPQEHQGRWRGLSAVNGRTENQAVEAPNPKAEPKRASLKIVAGQDMAAAMASQSGQGMGG